MLDIFYLTYKFDYSEKNYKQLKKVANENQRVVHVADVDGIYDAHKECAKQSQTKHFFVVDGDAFMADDFDFSYVPSETDEVYPKTCSAQCTHVWRARNPATGQVYGYGGVKLFARDAFMDKAFLDVEKGPLVDVTTEVAKRGYPYLPIEKISNDTVFNDTPFNAWKSAFRETTKLASGVATQDRKKRLDEWKNPLPGVSYSNEISLGARMGENYGTANANNPGRLFRINNWQVLRDWFKERQDWQPEPIKENVLDFKDGSYILTGIELLLEWMDHPQLEHYKEVRRTIHQKDKNNAFKLMSDILYNKVVVKDDSLRYMLQFLFSGVNKKFNAERAIHFMYELYEDKSPLQVFGVYLGAIVNTKGLDNNYVDALSYYQIQSKTWMLDKLGDMVEQDGKFGRTCIIGGWIGLSSYLLQKLEYVVFAKNIDIDENAIEFSKHLNAYNHHESEVCDALKHDYNDYELVINTSAEHMDNEWFERIKKGTTVVIQTNDFHDIPEHINTVNNMEELLTKYNFSELYYAGVQDCDRYNRFMLIGKK